jgi:hypothetical protein
MLIRLLNSATAVRRRALVAASAAVKSRFVLLACGLVICSQTLFAQLLIHERPISLGASSIEQRNGLKLQNLTPFNRIDTRFMARLNNDSLIKLNERKSLAKGPYQFGTAIRVNLGTHNAGTWDELPNGDRLWRLRIVSPDAYSLNFLYDNFDLPDSSLFFIYSDPDGRNSSSVLGAFNATHNRSKGKYATDIVAGSAVILEYYEPKAVRNRGKIVVSQVIHAYKNVITYSKQLLFSTKEQEKPSLQGLNDAAACNININCPQGNNYRNEQRGVALVLLNNGTAICSGSLINNTGTSYRPFFLTALHCVDARGVGGNGNGAVDLNERSTLESWLFRFNFERTGCDNSSGLNSQIEYRAGCLFRVALSNSDGLLVELRDKPSSALFYNGWDRSPATPATQAVGIHHPRGDVKKLAISNRPIGSVIASGGSQVDYLVDSWNVSWDFTSGLPNPNVGGITEVGSSGSPLLNPQRRIVGQLFAGASFCNSDGPDQYGKFSISWGGMQTWLDPSNSRMTYNGAAPMDIYIDGPTRLALGETSTYSAFVAGGVPNYQYNWFLRYGAGPTLYPISSGINCILTGTTDTDRYLILQVTDADGKMEQTEKYIFPGFIGLAKAIPQDTTIITVSTYPNPTNGEATISYALNGDAIVSVEVCNAALQPVHSIATKAQQHKGTHQYTIPATLSNGAYFIRITAQSANGSMYNKAIPLSVQR